VESVRRGVWCSCEKRNIKSKYAKHSNSVHTPIELMRAASGIPPSTWEAIQYPDGSVDDPQRSDDHKPRTAAQSANRSTGLHRMRPSEALASNRAAIRQVVESHRACNARVFGSVLRGKDTDGSDLDILVDLTPETTLMDVAAIQVALRRLLGVPVDVLTPRTLPYNFRSVVLAEAVPV
jgi:predicted nucleotidyltransferase